MPLNEKKSRRWLGLGRLHKAGKRKTESRAQQNRSNGMFSMAKFAALRSSKSSLSEQGTATVSSESLKSGPYATKMDPSIDPPAQEQSVPSEVSLGRPQAGSSTTQQFTTNECLSGSEPDEHCESDVSTGIRWQEAEGETLMVRSAGYRRTSEKYPSAGALYECLQVDVLNCPQRLPRMSDRVELPDLPLEEESDEAESRPESWFAPDIFVVTISLPMECTGNEDEAPCLTISAYFGMKAETKAILRQITSSDDDQSPKDNSARSEASAQVNAVRLFNEWCRRSPSEPGFQGRFKFIPHIANLTSFGVPGWVAKFSGKPVLIKRANKTGFLYSRKDESRHVMEMEVSLHPFPWVAKRALEQLRKEVFHKALLTLGFVIEAQEDDELPEVLLGLTQLCYPDSESAVPSKEFFPQSEDSAR
mmetsp:Transcript_25500/g.70425  ORF Transcript_25500/g.70425 Transcript_25500/m.70425 type:complete len:419 (-) Transcript_25500:136-1392(-)